jgi:hypothetical protein
MPSRSAYGQFEPWHRWQDWINLILGICLFIAPWVWRSTASVAAMNSADTNAWIVGAIVVIVSLCALAAPRSTWTEWVNTICGIWLFISPWVLAFTPMMRSQMSTDWVIGIVVAILAIWAGAQVGGRRTAASA